MFFKSLIYFISLFLFVSTYAEELRRGGFFAEAAALYWKAEVNGLDYAIKSPQNNQLSPDNKIETPDFRWKAGFKCGFGYRIPHDLWQIELHFTSLQTHTDAEKNGEEEVFFPVWLKPTDITQFADEVKMHWRLHLGLLDALLFKSFQTGESLFLTPFAGVRNGWIRQKFNLGYLGGNIAPENALIRMKNKYAGIGPIVGLTSKYEMGWGVSLCAKGAATVLFGEFYLHQDEDTLRTKEKLLGLHRIFHAAAPIFEGSLGLEWEHLFSGSLNRLSIELAWDQLLFFSQNQLLCFVSGNSAGQYVANQGDLSIAGVQLGFRFDF